MQLRTMFHKQREPACPARARFWLEGFIQDLCPAVPICTVITIAIFLSMIGVRVPAKSQAPPAVVIYDDDFGADYDVATNMTALHKLADENRLQILGIVVDGGWERSVGLAILFDKFYGRSSIPVGVYKGKLNDAPVPWAETLLKRFGIDAERSRYPDCVSLYRRLLSSAQDHSVTIVSTGGLTCLGPLLRSTSDRFSALDGGSLLRLKTRSLVLMGGAFPSGTETNLTISPSDSKIVFDRWRSQNHFPPLYAVDFETGARVGSGPYGGFSESNPERLAFDLNHAVWHQSWDSVAILFAAYGFRPDSQSHTPIFEDRGDGTNNVDASGSNTWNVHVHSGQHYITGRPDRLEPMLDGYLNCCGLSALPPGGPRAGGLRRFLWSLR